MHELYNKYLQARVAVCKFDVFLQSELLMHIIRDIIYIS